MMIQYHSSTHLFKRLDGPLICLILSNNHLSTEKKTTRNWHESNIEMQRKITDSKLFFFYKSLIKIVRTQRYIKQINAISSTILLAACICLFYVFVCVLSLTLALSLSFAAVILNAFSNGHKIDWNNRNWIRPFVSSAALIPFRCLVK